MKRLISIAVTAAMMLTMLISAQVTVMAAAPSIEDIEYKGKGRVEVDFRGKVKYKNSKVTVRDTKGNKYKVKKVKRDDDDIKFTIKNYKSDRTYKITVKGVKEKGTKKYGKVRCTLSGTGASGTAVDESKALQTAKDHAASVWGASDFFNIKAEKDYEGGKAVWEVEFKAKEGSAVYEYDYVIDASGGGIIRSDRELDD